MKTFLLPAVAFSRAIPWLVGVTTGFLATPAFAQKPLHITHGCAYKTAAEDTDLYTFEPSAEADRIVSEICNAVGLSQNFDIRGSNVDNAMAVVDGERRVILYSNLFLNKFNEDARTRWAAYSVLAHEIGHHLNYHNFGESNPGKRKTMELEADRFSGSALRLLGASLDEAKAGIETFALEGEQINHPSAKARKEALATGWNQQQERLEKMGAGIPNSDTNIPRERDSDGDGIPDRNDACPEEYGRSLTAGCPDADEDGITDSADKCRYLKGPAQWKGCPDSDGDGLPDHEDRCPKAPGQLADGGCPPPDKDGDSVIDRVDKCPDAYGLARYQGCPDTDGDGVPDHEDKCPKEVGQVADGGCPSQDRDGDLVIDRADKCPDTYGLARYQGCPDTDGDGVPDSEDGCPKEVGHVTNGGCPSQDRDGDLVIDRVDKCPEIFGLARYQGCPDSDGDGVPDPEDKCPKQKGEPLYDGCANPSDLEPKKAPSNMVFVEGGTFIMGCKDGRDKDCLDSEKPLRSVEVADFYIGRYEVTQAEWVLVMGSNPSGFKNCENCPVENVNWNDVQEFIKKLNAQNPKNSFRLPSEAEWEYAARGGNLSKGYTFSGSNTLSDVAWYAGNSNGKSHPIGGLNANELGLFDMSGNVWEWCGDYWHSNYIDAPKDGQIWRDYQDDSRRVNRGGSLRSLPLACRVSHRDNNTSGGRGFNIGFRLASSPQ